MGKRFMTFTLIASLMGLGACASSPLKRRMASSSGGTNFSSNYGIK